MGTKVKIIPCFTVQFVVCCAIIVLNLSAFVLANSNGKCATLYNSYSYQGSPLSVTDGSKQPNLRHMNFVPLSVRVTPGCFLTIFDIYGNPKTMDRDHSNIGWMSNRLLDATCCECGGCNGAANKLDGLCARLYENPRCDSCSGYRLDLKIGDQAKNFGPLDNMMTSVAVRQGCTLTVFFDRDFEGWRFNFTHSNNMMGDNWSKHISSAKCGCDSVNHEQPVTLPTVPPYMTLPTVPTRAPITLPTVPTRAPITLPTVPTRAPITLPTVPTRAPITLPTVPTRAPITLPTVPTTKAPITLPTVPTTKAPITLPTVPTTKAPITLPTVPTTKVPITIPTLPTTKAPPITLPTKPPTVGPDTDEDPFFSSEETSEGDNYYGGDKSNELLPTTTTTTTTTTEIPISEETLDGDGGWDFEKEPDSNEEDEEEEEEEEEGEEDKWDDW